MSQEELGGAHARQYRHALEPKSLEPRLLALAEGAATAAFTALQMKEALGKGLEDAATLMRAVPIQEGNLLERGIVLLAASNPDMLALTENLRLPVTPAALELVGLNDERLYRRLTLDADRGGRKGYTPDMILVHRSKRLAHVVDIKRTLGSYETTRIADLKSRMLASSLVVPDLLYKEHRRIAVDEVRAVIVTADSQKTDIDNGIWPLAHLDHLLELDGAGLAIEWLRQQFAIAVERNWRHAVKQLAAMDQGRETSRALQRTAKAFASSKTAMEEDDADDTVGISFSGMTSARSKFGSDASSRASDAAPPPLRIGFARPPVSPVVA
ncbi:MAG TPA: hypothetical protein VE079_15240 [Ensifer sp.]|nr:hypothetical protein [Ensifer sp.]